MKIGELAEACQLSTKAIRYYESIGLVEPRERAANGYRVYDQRAIERINFVRNAQATGLSLTEIRSILELKDAGQRSCSHTRELLERHVDHLQQQIAELQHTLVNLQEMAGRAAGLDPGACTDPDRCQVIGSDSAR